MRLSKNYLKVGVHRCKHQDCTPWGLTCLLCPSLPPPLPPPLPSPLLSHLLTPTLYIPSLKISSHLHHRRLYGWWGDPQPQHIGANVLPLECNLALTSSFALYLFCLSLALQHMAVHDLPQICHHVDSNYQFDWVSHCICATGMNGLVMLDLNFLTVHRAFLYV